MSVDMEKAVRLYIRLRDEKEAIEAECKERIAPIKEKLDFIEGATQKYLDDHGMTSLKTAAGTAYRSEVKAVKIDDWEAVQNFIKEKEAWDLLNRAVNKTALVNEYNSEVPGVRVETVTKTNFRRA